MSFLDCVVVLLIDDFIGCKLRTPGPQLVLGTSSHSLRALSWVLRGRALRTRVSHRQPKGGEHRLEVARGARTLRR